MGIACAPQIWMDYITLILAELEDKKRYTAIMDDLLIHSTKVAHFREVKLRLTNPPVLHLPKAEGRFILYSDTSIEGTGSSLWQIQEGKPRLIGYASKTLPEACSRYSVTELEMTGLIVNMNLWKNLLKHREFDAAVDHVAVVQIMKAKTEPATTRIMRLLDRLSA